MWDVLSGDYNTSISDDECLKNTLKYSSDGSIVVFHDSYKAEKKLKSVLPKYIKELDSQGFSFKSL
jgi:peptidoglycan/xylan/chitin deacetylase (PgdA/CDA1 family)